MTAKLIPGVRPPQQARSRAALQKILAAAEDVLTGEGYDAMTMVGVAERAGVSVGAIYRRFDGKEQLVAAVKDRMLSELESDLGGRLRSAEPVLDDLVEALVGALTDAFRDGGALLPGVMRPSPTELAARGRQAMETIRVLFEEAVRPHLAQVRRPQPEVAVVVAVEIAVGATIHRAAGWPASYGDVSWPVFRRQLGAMVSTYLGGAGV